MPYHGVSCRFCGSRKLVEVLDLGTQPLANSLVSSEDLLAKEDYYALVVLRCGQCGLVQVPEVASARDIFSDYLYFSSYSESWLTHARNYVEAVTARFCLGSGSQVVEIASNDGYLLQYFVGKGVPCLGIEPAANVARAAHAKGVETLVSFFTTDLAKHLVADGRSADLIVGNNVLAHVPPLNDFVAGMQRLLKPSGVITMEFPHLVRLIEDRLFDTIYHEHYSYYLLTVAERIFAAHGLRIFDVDLLPTHGGSLRIYACHQAAAYPTSASVKQVTQSEIAHGYDQWRRYAAFSNDVYGLKRELLQFFLDIKREGQAIAAYGAAAKGNTLLNFLGVRSDFIDFVADRNPVKQGRFMPGSRIPILTPDAISEHKPNYLIILPWNLREEVSTQMEGIRAWGGKFVVLLPKVTVF